MVFAFASQLLRMVAVEVPDDSDHCSDHIKPTQTELTSDQTKFSSWALGLSSKLSLIRLSFADVTTDQIEFRALFGLLRNPETDPCLDVCAL